MISDIYGAPFSGATTAAAGGTFGAMSVGLKYAVSRAVQYVPVVGPLIRTVTAAVTIEAIGFAIIAHFERRFPDKPFTTKTD